jgi:hypothetical protein
MRVGDKVKIIREDWENEDIDKDKIHKYINSFGKVGIISSIERWCVIVKLSNGDTLELDFDEFEVI